MEESSLALISILNKSTVAILNSSSWLPKCMRFIYGIQRQWRPLYSKIAVCKQYSQCDSDWNLNPATILHNGLQTPPTSDSDVSYYIKGFSNWNGSTSQMTCLKRNFGKHVTTSWSTLPLDTEKDREEQYSKACRLCGKKEWMKEKRTIAEEINLKSAR